MKKHNETLFKIGEVTKIMGVARKTLLVFEEMGLLIPEFKDEESGYRYYSADNMTQIRAGNTSDAETACNELSGQVDTISRDINVAVENYPDLKANTNFAKLQDELSETEDKVTFSRQFYNDTVTNYNDQIQVFPSNIVAGMFNFTEEQTFLVDDEAARKAPKVQF